MPQSGSAPPANIDDGSNNPCRQSLVRRWELLCPKQVNSKNAEFRDAVNAEVNTLKIPAGQRRYRNVVFLRVLSTSRADYGPSGTYPI